MIEVLEWKDSLMEILGDNLDPDAIEFVILKMMTGQLDYDKNLGIQNIFSGLKQIRKTTKGYEVINTFY